MARALTTEATEATGPALAPVEPQPPAAGTAARVARAVLRSSYLDLLLIVIVLIALWQLAITVLNPSPLEFPTPGDVLKVFGNSHQALLSNLWPTLEEAVIGMAASIVIGIPLGFVLALPGRLSRAFYSLIVLLQTVPRIAVAPIFVVWLGFGASPKYIFVFLLSFFPIVLNTNAGVRSVPMDMRNLTRILRMGRLEAIRRVELPYALPSIFSGIKIAVTLSVIGAIVAEFVGSNTGLGYLIVQGEGNIEMPLIFACVIVVSILGYVLFAIVGVAERLMIPWHVSQRSDR
jgi:NitT/TauT family transport system permease protein